MSQTPHVDIPPEPYVPPTPEGPRKTIRVLGASAPFYWLASGWQDSRAYPGISAFYGLSFCLMALVLGAVFQSKPEYTMSIASGCLLLGPFLALGLYEVSQRRERGEIPRLSSSLVCWRSHVRSMSMLVLVNCCGAGHRWWSLPSFSIPACPLLPVSCRRFSIRKTGNL